MVEGGTKFFEDILIKIEIKVTKTFLLRVGFIPGEGYPNQLVRL